MSNESNISENAIQAMNIVAALEKLNEMIDLNVQNKNEIMVSLFKLKKEILTNNLKKLLKNVGEFICTRRLMRQ